MRHMWPYWPQAPHASSNLRRAAISPAWWPFFPHRMRRCTCAHRRLRRSSDVGWKYTAYYRNPIPRQPRSLRVLVVGAAAAVASAVTVASAAATVGTAEEQRHHEATAAAAAVAAAVVVDAVAVGRHLPQRTSSTRGRRHCCPSATGLPSPRSLRCHPVQNHGQEEECAGWQKPPSSQPPALFA